jgi:hypothetical protein
LALRRPARLHRPGPGQQRSKAEPTQQKTSN